MDGFAHANVSATAAEIAVHGGIDLLVGWLGSALQQGRGGHDLAGLAVAALGDIHVNPGLLERMRVVGREAFDGGDFLVSRARDWQ